MAPAIAVGVRVRGQGRRAGVGDLLRSGSGVMESLGSRKWLQY